MVGEPLLVKRQSHRIHLGPHLGEIALLAEDCDQLAEIGTEIGTERLGKKMHTTEILSKKGEMIGGMTITAIVREGTENKTTSEVEVEVEIEVAVEADGDHTAEHEISFTTILSLLCINE